MFSNKFTHEERRATSSAGLNPASAIRARMSVMVSNGSGTKLSGAGAVALGRPMKKFS